MLKFRTIRPFQLLIKPTSGDCNINCMYCFYRRVKEIYPGRDGVHVMPENVLECLIYDLLSYNFSTSVFSWQGGEPTLAGLDFFKTVVDLQKKYGHRGQVIGNSIQTNGILINKDWAQFLAKYKFLVGISLDGPEDAHNYYRQNSYKRVMDAIEILKEYNVEFNILTVVSEANVRRGREIYQFFRKNGFSYLQFIPCLEWDPEKQKSRPYTFHSSDYGEFLCQAFDEWIKNDISKVSVRLFEDIMSYYLGKGNPSCTFKDRCDSYLVVEHNGDIYPCDFFVYPEWKLGNLLENSLMDISNSELRKKFANRKEELSEDCKHCEWLPLCHNGCQVDRFYPIRNANVNKNNYLCSAYKKFFAYSENTFREIANRLEPQVKNK